MTSIERKAPPLVEVRLYGHLRRRFGKTHRYAVASSGEAVRALCATVPGFRNYMLWQSAPGYRVWSGRGVLTDTNQLFEPSGTIVRIVPVTVGAKSGGIGAVIMGAALIYLSYQTGGLGMALKAAYAEGGLALAGSAIAGSIGIGLVLAGVSQMLVGNPASDAPSERPENLPSYAFNGAVNTTAQGNPVPVLYGRLRVGSQVISSGLSTARLA